MIRPNKLSGKQFVRLILHALPLFLLAATSIAAPAITSVEPPVGITGQELEVTLHGTGLNENTRVVIFPDSGNRLQILGSADTIYSMHSVAVVCNIAYVTAEYSLQIIDVRISTDPVLLETVNLPSYGMEIAVRSGVAYVLTESHGLLIFDISDPVNPIPLGNVLLPIQPQAIAFENHYAYVANGTGGLQVIDVLDPRHPKIVGSNTLPGGATGIAVSGHTAFVTNDSSTGVGSGLLVFDVHDPTEPVLLGSVQTPGVLSMDVALVGQTAYVADWDAGLQIIDVRNPQQPAIISSADTPGDALSVVVVDNTAYVAAGNSGLQVIDVSNTSKPVYLGSIQTDDRAYDVSVENNLAYIAAGNLEIADIGNITRSSTIGMLPTPPGSARGVTVVNTTAYIADYDLGLHIIDISDPAVPVLRSTLSLPGNALDVAVSGNTAYVAAYKQGLQVVDVSDSNNPFIIGSIANFAVEGSWAFKVEVVNNIAYLASYLGGLQIIDVADPLEPTKLGYIETRTQNGQSLSAVRDVVVRGGTAYLADEWVGLCIVDVSNPAFPSMRSTIRPGGIYYGLTVSDNIAYLVGYNGLFQLIDISDPSHPFLRSSVGTTTYSNGWDIAVVGQTAYIAANLLGIHLFDVNNPAEPTFLASIDTLGGVYDLAVVDDIVYVADGEGGLCTIAAPQQIVPHTVSDPAEIKATLLMHFAGDYTLRVFDGTGGSELPGAVTFLDQLPEAKAVIVAGYGPHPSNKLWDETLVNASHAWNVLVAQGYPRENIRYLSPVPVDADGDGQSDVFGDATLNALRSTLTSPWATGADDLLLYLVGHGSSKNFVMKHTDTLHEELAAWKLAGWLDDLQADHGMRAVGVLEACYSGSFLDALQLEQGAGFERTLLTSSAASQVSILGNNGLTSFSHRFWESLYEQGELVRAFTEASDMMAGFGQTPWLDGNCDGLPNTAADSARETVVGRGYNFQSPLKPFVSCTSPDRVLRNTKSALLWAKTVSTNPLSRVWAEIIPPGYDPLAPDAPPLPTVELTWSESRRRYEGSYGQFIKRGTYHVALYARDNQQVVSLPRISRFTVPLFPWNLFLPAVIFKE